MIVAAVYGLGLRRLGEAQFGYRVDFRSACNRRCPTSCLWRSLSLFSRLCAETGGGYLPVDYSVQLRSAFERIGTSWLRTSDPPALRSWGTTGLRPTAPDT